MNSNFGVAKNVLRKVVIDHKFRGLYEAFDYVLEQHLRDGVLKDVPYVKYGVTNNVRIPHSSVKTGSAGNHES